MLIVLVLFVFLICFFKGLFLMVSFAIDILLLRSGALLLFS